jgi:hypothetical protein
MFYFLFNVQLSEIFHRFRGYLLNFGEIPIYEFDSENKLRNFFFRNCSFSEIPIGIPTRYPIPMANPTPKNRKRNSEGATKLSSKRRCFFLISMVFFFRFFKTSIFMVNFSKKDEFLIASNVVNLYTWYEYCKRRDKYK